MTSVKEQLIQKHRSLLVWLTEEREMKTVFADAGYWFEQAGIITRLR